MLDALRNISILNHFLQNVTCSMWVVLVYYDPFELTTFQQEYGDDPVSHQSFAE